jgi:hypothetical protein
VTFEPVRALIAAGDVGVGYPSLPSGVCLQRPPLPPYGAESNLKRVVGRSELLADITTAREYVRLI